MKFLVFELGNTRYALPLSSVREIMPVPAITEVPRSPAVVAGITLAAGRVITVVDLARILRLDNLAPSECTRLVLVQGRDEVLGLLVGKVVGVHVLHRDQIENVPPASGLPAAWGTAHSGEPGADRLLLLDPASLL
jgi:chemotaxis signal transduction protein